MITRIHGKVVFECDRCSEQLDTGESEFGDALQELRAEGWKAHKVGNDWHHECESCQGDRA